MATIFKLPNIFILKATGKCLIGLHQILSFSIESQILKWILTDSHLLSIIWFYFQNVAALNLTKILLFLCSLAEYTTKYAHFILSSILTTIIFKFNSGIITCLSKYIEKEEWQYGNMRIIYLGDLCARTEERCGIYNERTVLSYCKLK